MSIFTHGVSRYGQFLRTGVLTISKRAVQELSAKEFIAVSIDPVTKVVKLTPIDVPAGTVSVCRITSIDGTTGAPRIPVLRIRRFISEVMYPYACRLAMQWDGVSLTVFPAPVNGQEASDARVPGR